MNKTFQTSLHKIKYVALLSIDILIFPLNVLKRLWFGGSFFSVTNYFYPSNLKISAINQAGLTDPEQQLIQSNYERNDEVNSSSVEQNLISQSRNYRAYTPSYSRGPSSDSESRESSCTEVRPYTPSDIMTTEYDIAEPSDFNLAIFSRPSSPIEPSSPRNLRLASL